MSSNPNGGKLAAQLDANKSVAKARESRQEEGLVVRAYQYLCLRESGLRGRFTQWD